MARRTHRWLLAGAALGAASGLVWLVATPGERAAGSHAAVATAPAPVPSATWPAALNPGRPNDGALHGGKTDAKPSAAAAADLQRYTFLVSSRSATDQHAAYKMLRACEMPRVMLNMVAQAPRGEMFNEIHAELSKEVAELATGRCASLPHADVRVRLRLLERAIAGGVGGAWSDWFFEGPNGNAMDLIHRSDDLLVRDWVRTSTAAVAELARKGDVESAYLLANFHSYGPPTFVDLDKAALYEVLGFELLKRSNVMLADRQTFRQRAVNAALANLPAERAAAIRLEVAAILAKL